MHHLTRITLWHKRCNSIRRKPIKQGIKMKKQSILLVLVLSCLPLWSQPDENEKMQRLLNRLDQQIETARNLLRVFPDPRAQELLDQVVAFRNEAENLIGNRRYRLAELRIRSAEKLAEQIINRLSVVPMQRIKNDIQELLKKAEKIPAQNKDAIRLVRQAKENRNRAERAEKFGENQKALEFYRVAKFMLEKALQNGADSPRSLRDQLVAEKDRFENLFDRARSASSACTDPHAQKLLQEAEKQYEKIKAAYAQNNIRFALTLYHNTTRLLLRVIDLCEGYTLSERESVIRDLEALSDLISTARRELKSPNQRQKLILAKVTQLLSQARSDIDREQIYLAAQKVVLANNFLNRIWNLQQGIGMRQRIETEIEKLQQEMDRIEQNSRAARSGLYVQAARQSLEKAEKFYRQGMPRLALQSLLASNRFLTYAQNQTALQPLSAELFENEQNRLKKEIDQKQSLGLTDPEAQAFLNASIDMHQRALAAKKKGHDILAGEYLRHGFDLIERIDNESERR